MNLAEKHNIKREDRYDILTINIRQKIIDRLREPLKKRGSELKKLIDTHPRLLDEEKKPTEHLIINNNKYIDGHIIEKGTDQKGVYAIFQAKDRTENEKWQYIIKKSEKLAILAHLQRSLIESNIDYNKIQEIKVEIDILFDEVFNTKSKTKKTPDFPKYCEIGSLFAQGYLSKNKFNFYFKELEFESVSKLSEYLIDEVLETKTSVRQYVNDTLKENKGKNFFESKKMMKNIIEYCRVKDIKITQPFQSKHDTLNHLH